MGPSAEETDRLLKNAPEHCNRLERTINLESFLQSHSVDTCWDGYCPKSVEGILSVFLESLFCFSLVWASWILLVETLDGGNLPDDCAGERSMLIFRMV